MMTAAFWIPVVIFTVALVTTFVVLVDVRRKTFKWYTAVIAFIMVAIFIANLWPIYEAAVQREVNAQWRREHPNSRRVFE